VLKYTEPVLLYLFLFVFELLSHQPWCFSILSLSCHIFRVTYFLVFFVARIFPYYPMNFECPCIWCFLIRAILSSVPVSLGPTSLLFQGKEIPIFRYKFSILSLLPFLDPMDMRTYYRALDSKKGRLSRVRFLLTCLSLIVFSFVLYRGTYVLT